jgi:ribosome-associated translation inhibitor RaiA
MKITYSHIEPELRETIEHETEHYVAKLNRLLKHYPADSVLLHESLEKSPHQHEFSFSLNLTFPAGTLHATGVGADKDVRASAKAAFAEIERQVKKHQEKLRKDYLWKRKRPRATLPTPGEVPSAD